MACADQLVSKNDFGPALTKSARANFYLFQAKTIGALALGITLALVHRR
jgi:hypothetical protein